jgi:hypothetical protein
VHYSERGAGLMFDAVSSEQHRILHGWLFSGLDGGSTDNLAMEQGARAVA